MKFLKLFVVVLVLLSAPVVSAESSFVNHVDLFQAGMVDGKTVIAPDIGYHFTAIQFGRVRTLGGGLALDVYSVADTYYMNERLIKVRPLLVVPIVDVRLNNPKPGEDTPTVSFGTNYIYDLKRKVSGVSVGFMFSSK